MMATKRPKKTPLKSVQDIKDAAGQLPSGVDGTNVPVDFNIPGSTLADVDRAVFNLFEKRLRLEVTVGQNVIQVPTVFAGSERVFTSKKNAPPRDKTGAFILPIVSIHRTSLEQSEMGVVPGRGLGQDTGELVVKKRLSSIDAKYQSLINKLQLQNQDNVATDGNLVNSSSPEGVIPGRIGTRRLQQKSFNTITGEYLSPDLNQNIFEIITTPFPHFYTAIYEVTVWAQYIQHMNSIIERFMTSYDAQGNQFRLDTDKGYWYVAYVDDDFSSEDNFSDYTEDERFIKYKFSLKVPAYFYANERKGVLKPFRTYLSAPQISFEIFDGGPPVSENSGAPVGSGDINKFILSDVTQLDKRGDVILDEKQPSQRLNDVVVDPYSGKTQLRYVRILSRNQRKGETVLSRRVIKKIGDVNF